MEQLFYITGDTHPSVHSLSINYLEKKEEGKQKGIHNSEMFLSGNLIIMPHTMKVINSEGPKLKVNKVMFK